jgi:tetratricopeptide (TPR) repeat protein
MLGLSFFVEFGTKKILEYYGKKIFGKTRGEIVKELDTELKKTFKKKFYDYFKKIYSDNKEILTKIITAIDKGLESGELNIVTSWYNKQELKKIVTNEKEEQYKIYTESMIKLLQGRVENIEIRKEAADGIKGVLKEIQEEMNKKIANKERYREYVSYVLTQVLQIKADELSKEHKEIVELLKDNKESIEKVSEKVLGKGEENWERLYKIIWKPVAEIEKLEFMGPERAKYGFKKYYERDVDKKLKEKLAKGNKNILIYAPPLAGKTRLLFEQLKNQKEAIVLMLKHIDLDLAEKILPPLPENAPAKKIIILDDLQLLLEKKDFGLYLTRLLEELFNSDDIRILATCRSGEAYKKTKNRLLKEHNLNIGDAFPERIEIEDLSEEEGRKLAENYNIDWQKVEFDRTVGSIFLEIGEKKRRYNEECSNEEKAMLKAAKWAYLAGLAVEKTTFPTAWIQRIFLGLFYPNSEPGDQEEYLEKLKELELLQRETEELIVDEVFFEKIIEPQKKILTVTDFENLRKIFQENPEALLLLGEQLIDIGKNSLEKRSFLRKAVKVLNNIKKPGMNERLFARKTGNLGNAYLTLAGVEETAANCEQAIKAYKKALTVYTKEQLPLDYAAIQNNLGNAYLTLAEVEEKAANCEQAIKAYEKALTIRTKEQLPLDYAATQNNLGSAYAILAEVEEKAAKCKQAIKAYKEAIVVLRNEGLYFARIAIHNLVKARIFCASERGDDGAQRLPKEKRTALVKVWVEECSEEEIDYIALMIEIIEKEYNGLGKELLEKLPE